MRKSRFSEAVIIYAVKEVEMGISIGEVAREYAVCENIIYRWHRKYDGLSPSEGQRLKDLEHGNSHLKKLAGDLSLDKENLQPVLRNSSEACLQPWIALRDDR